MPKGQPLSDSQRCAIYNAYTEGESYEDIAATYGIAASTVRKTINEQRRRRDMASRSKIVAGDKTNGRLTSTTDPHRFEGTCVVCGKRHSKTFVSTNARDATERWEKWCQELRDEQAFMDMVERKVVCGAPLDPIEEIRPIKTVELPDDEKIYEAQQEFDAITEKHLEATGVPLADTSEPAYLIWAKSPEPRCYGLYLTMESALAEVDKLNDVARFLGNIGVFEVEEVAWR